METVIASIWGLYLALRKPASSQTIIAGRSIRDSAIESSHFTDQKVIAGQDIIGSPIKHFSNKSGN